MKWNGRESKFGDFHLWVCDFCWEVYFKGEHGFVRLAGEKCESSEEAKRQAEKWFDEKVLKLGRES